MDQQLAQQAFEELGTLVLLGMPIGTEFGIDMNSWNVGQKFKGVKMIPPGLHFIHFSAVSRQGETAPRTGFFHYFKLKELVVRHYDPSTEDLENKDPDPVEVERIRSNLHDLDRFLGPYPMDSWKKWISLIQYVSEDDMTRMVPLSGKINSVPELVSKQPSRSCDRLKEMKEQASTSGESSKPRLPEMEPVSGTEIRFSEFPKRPYPDGASPSEITRYSLDSSYSVKKLLESIGKLEGLLGELQFAFTCFLVGQVWEGWEHWRRLLTALCSAEEFMVEKHEIYPKLISVIHFQMQEVPEDFFVDIVESSNFLAAALTTLFANISDNASSLPPALVTRAQKFKEHLASKFEWDLTIEDDDEDAPVIVETE